MIVDHKLILNNSINININKNIKYRCNRRYFINVHELLREDMYYVITYNNTILIKNMTYTCTWNNISSLHQLNIVHLHL